MRSTIRLIWVLAIGIMLLSAPIQADDGQIDIVIDPVTGYTITKSGSYVVVANVTMTADVSAITIADEVHDVTIDLKGHTLTGSGSGSGVDGIAGIDSNRLHVFNGGIRGFAGDGIDADSFAHIHDVIVEDNDADGISCGSNALVESCQASGNNKAGGKAGISVAIGATVRDCVSNNNNPTSSGATMGIDSGNDCTLIGNTCKGNTSPDDEAIGINTGVRSSVIDNTCNNNVSGGSLTATGIRAGGQCTIVNNAASGNVNIGTGDADGISAGDGCTIRGNSCNGNAAGNSGGGTGAGIRAGNGSTIIGNTCHLNFGLMNNASGKGIVVMNGSVVRENTCMANQATGMGSAFGIEINGGYNRVVENNCSANQQGEFAVGIYVGNGDNNVVARNTASSNVSGGAFSAGIFIGDTGFNNTVQDNTTNTNTTYGIRSMGSDNLFLGNRASGNGTPFIFDATLDTFGTIVDATASGSVGTTDPLANIFY